MLSLSSYIILLPETSKQKQASLVPMKKSKFTNSSNTKKEVIKKLHEFLQFSITEIAWIIVDMLTVHFFCYKIIYLVETTQFSEKACVARNTAVLLQTAFSNLDETYLSF